MPSSVAVLPIVELPLNTLIWLPSELSYLTLATTSKSWATELVLVVFHNSSVQRNQEYYNCKHATGLNPVSKRGLNGNDTIYSRYVGALIAQEGRPRRELAAQTVLFRDSDRHHAISRTQHAEQSRRNGVSPADELQPHRCGFGTQGDSIGRLRDTFDF